MLALLVPSIRGNWSLVGSDARSFGFGPQVLHSVHEPDPRALVAGSHHLRCQPQEREPPHLWQVALQKLARPGKSACKSLFWAFVSVSEDLACWLYRRKAIVCRQQPYFGTKEDS